MDVSMYLRRLAPATAMTVVILAFAVANATPRERRELGETYSNFGWPFTALRQDDDSFHPSILSVFYDQQFHWQITGLVGDGLLAIVLGFATFCLVRRLFAVWPIRFKFGLSTLFSMITFGALLLSFFMYEHQWWQFFGWIINCSAIFSNERTIRQPWYLMFPLVGGYTAAGLMISSWLLSLAKRIATKPAKTANSFRVS